MYCNRINQTTFGCDQGQILTAFDEGVNADVFSLSFLSILLSQCKKTNKKQIPGTVYSMYYSKGISFLNYLELYVNVSVIQLRI